jgi:hypothetical protein
MATSNDPAHPHLSLPPGAERHSFPLRFKTHNFGAYCYNTYGGKVLYNNFYHALEPDDKLRPPARPEQRDRWDGDYGGVENFPSPAVVKWRSLDGVEHEASIDIGEIFRDQLILHNVREQDIPEYIAIGTPSIVLVIDDRTINVYMRTFIPLKRPRTPGNTNSDYQDDLILARSYTF